MFDGYIDALVALDAMPAEEKELWRGRLRVTDADDGRPLNSLLPAVEVQLERAFAELPETIEAMSDEALRFNALIGAAHQIGALPGDAFGAWALRMGARLARPSHPPPALDPEELARMQAVANAPQRGELLRVVRGPDVRHAGLRVRFVELYENGVTVCWHFVSRDEAWPRQQDHLGRCVDLRDDKGTGYSGRGGGGSRMGTTDDGQAIVTGHDDFSPAAPPDVRTLAIDYVGHEFHVDVPPA